MTSYCSNCIHKKVCGNEGVDDLAMTYCADKQEERPTAEWVVEKNYVDRYEYVSCSSCGHFENHTSKYCPACGARMRGDE